MELLAARGLALLNGLCEYDAAPFLDHAAASPPGRALAELVVERALALAGAPQSPPFFPSSTAPFTPLELSRASCAGVLLLLYTSLSGGFCSAVLQWWLW